MNLSFTMWRSWSYASLQNSKFLISDMYDGSKDLVDHIETYKAHMPFQNILIQVDGEEMSKEPKFEEYQRSNATYYPCVPLKLM
jgi:hypothetical protein